jgi:hypothetical protein
MTTTAATATSILKLHASQQDTSVLLDSLAILDRDADEHERLVRATILTVIEGRHPEIIPAIDAWADSLMDTRTYARVVLDEMGR